MPSFMMALSKRAVWMWRYPSSPVRNLKKRSNQWWWPSPSHFQLTQLVDHWPVESRECYDNAGWGSCLWQRACDRYHICIWTLDSYPRSLQDDTFSDAVSMTSCSWTWPCIPPPDRHEDHQGRVWATAIIRSCHMVLDYKTCTVQYVLDVDKDLVLSWLCNHTRSIQRDDRCCACTTCGSSDPRVKERCTHSCDTCTDSHET